MLLPASLYKKEADLGIKVVKRSLDDLLPIEKPDSSRRGLKPSILIQSLFHKMYDCERFSGLVEEEKKYFNDRLVVVAYAIIKERLPPRIDYMRLRIASLSNPLGCDNTAMIKYAETINNELLKDILSKRLGVVCDFEKNVLVLKCLEDEALRVVGKIGRNVFYVSPAEASFMRNQDGWFLDRLQYDALLRVFGSKQSLEREIGRFEKSYIPHPKMLDAVDIFDDLRLSKGV